MTDNKQYVKLIEIEIYEIYAGLITCYFQKLKTNDKKENLQILDLWLWKAMCISKRNQRPLEDVMGSLSHFISTKKLVVMYM